VSELEGKAARVHVNCFRAVPDGRDVDSSAPKQKTWPDVRRVLLGVLGERTVRDSVKYQVQKAGRNEFILVEAVGLPDVVVSHVVVSAYVLSRGERASTDMEPDVAKEYFTAQVLFG
jgi:hypothetical protein